MGAGDIRAGGGYIEMWLEKSRVSTGLGQLKNEAQVWASQISNLGMGLSVLGGAITAPLALSAKAFADNGSRIDDFAQRTGASVEAVSQLQYAAVQTGTGIDTLEKSMGKMSETISGAIQHEEGAVLSLKKLGLTAGDLRGKLPEQQLGIFADKLAAISDVNLRMDLARAIFGKGGGDLIPLLQHGSAGIDQLRERADRLGLTLSKEDATAAAEFGDSLDDMRSATMAIANAVGGSLAPALKVAADLTVACVKPTADFIKENKLLITTVAASGAAILLTGGALTTLGLGLTLAAAAIPGLVAAGSVLAAVALSPITWIVAAGAAVVGVIGYVTGGFTMMAAAGRSLLEGTTGVLQGIANALQAGNIQAAWAIAGAALTVGWIATINGLKAGWRGFTDYIADAISVRLGGVLAEMAAFTSEFQAMTGINIGTGFTGNLSNSFKSGTKDRQNASEAAAKNDNTQLTAAKAVLQALIDSVKPGDRLSFGNVPDIDKITAAEDAKKSKTSSGKTDDTADAITARGALGLGGQTSLQQKMASDISGIHKEVKAANTRASAGRNGKPASRPPDVGGGGFAVGQIPAGVDPGLFAPDAPALDMKPDTAPVHVPVAGNMFGITLPADFTGGQLAPQTSIRDTTPPKEGAAAERTAKASEATARETKRIADKAEQGIVYGT